MGREKTEKELADKQAGFLSYSLRLLLIRLTKLAFQAERGYLVSYTPFLRPLPGKHRGKRSRVKSFTGVTFGVVTLIALMLRLRARFLLQM